MSSLSEFIVFKKQYVKSIQVAYYFRTYYPIN